MATKLECEFCGDSRVPMRLTTFPDGNPEKPDEEYVVCANCLGDMATFSLSSDQFLRAKARGGDVDRFYLHDDFYDPMTGRSAQTGIRLT